MKQKVKKLGVVWIAGAKVYDSDGKLIGKCLDTPNAITWMFKSVKDAAMVKTSMGKLILRSDKEYGVSRSCSKCETRFVRCK